MVYKPGSVISALVAKIDEHSSRTNVTERLKRPTRIAVRKHKYFQITLKTSHSYLVLLPVGFTLPYMLPYMRCALTAPFHPYHKGGIFSVALSLRSPSPGVTRHRVSWSPDFPLLKSDHPTI